jgi:hypothetical protein
MCTHCNDTGSLSKDLNGFLDCAYCDVAAERVALSQWAELTGVEVSISDLWLIYQRGKHAAYTKERIK